MLAGLPVPVHVKLERFLVVEFEDGVDGGYFHVAEMYEAEEGADLALPDVAGVEVHDGEGDDGMDEHLEILVQHYSWINVIKMRQFVFKMSGQLSQSRSSQLSLVKQMQTTAGQSLTPSLFLARAKERAIHEVRRDSLLHYLAQVRAQYSLSTQTTQTGCLLLCDQHEQCLNEWICPSHSGVDYCLASRGNVGLSMAQITRCMRAGLGGDRLASVLQFVPQSVEGCAEASLRAFLQQATYLLSNCYLGSPLAPESKMLLQSVSIILQKWQQQFCQLQDFFISQTNSDLLQLALSSVNLCWLLLPTISSRLSCGDAKQTILLLQRYSMYFVSDIPCLVKLVNFLVWSGDETFIVEALEAVLRVVEEGGWQVVERMRHSQLQVGHLILTHSPVIFRLLSQVLDFLQQQL